MMSGGSGSGGVPISSPGGLPPPYPGFNASGGSAGGVTPPPGAAGGGGQHPGSSPYTHFPHPKQLPPGQQGACPSSGVHPTPQYSDAEEKQRIRFQVELEFVQCLGNPNYLHFLAQRGYFKDSKFINYLEYLQYWKEPKYVKFIKYPVCLHFLELLLHESFRKEIVNGQVS